MALLTIDTVLDFSGQEWQSLQYINDLIYLFLAILVFITIRKFDHVLERMQIDRASHNKWFMWVQFFGFTIIIVVVLI